MEQHKKVGYEKLVNSLIQHTKNDEIEWERISGKNLISGLLLGRYVKLYDDMPDIVGVDNYKFTSDNARDLYRAVQEYLRTKQVDEWANQVVNGIN